MEGSKAAAFAQLVDDFPGAMVVLDDGGRIMAANVDAMALLETSAPSYRWFDAVPSGGRIRVITALLFQVFTGMVCLLGGLVLFAPIQLLTRFEKSA